MKYFSEIRKNGHIWQENHNNTENQIDKTKISREKQQKNTNDLIVTIIVIGREV